MANQSVADEGDPHTGTGDVVRGHLLVQLQNDSGGKTIGLTEKGASPSGIIFLFQQNKSFIFELLQGNRGSFFVQKSATADLLHRELVAFKTPVDGESSGNGQNQVFLMKKPSAEDGFVEGIIVDGEIQNAGEEKFLQPGRALLNEIDLHQREAAGKITDEMREDTGGKKAASA